MPERVLLSFYRARADKPKFELSIDKNAQSVYYI